MKYKKSKLSLSSDTTDSRRTRLSPHNVKSVCEKDRSKEILGFRAKHELQKIKNAATQLEGELGHESRKESADRDSEVISRKLRVTKPEAAKYHPV